MDHETDKGPAWSAVADMPKATANALGRTGRDVDYLHVDEGSGSFVGECTSLHKSSSENALVSGDLQAEEDPFAVYTSPVIACQFPATQFLPSWNIKHSDNAGFRIYMRVFDAEGKASEWLFLGEGGHWRRQPDEVTVDDNWGKVRVDYLDLHREAHSFQYRVEFIAADDNADAQSVSAGIHRFFVHYSGIGAEDVSPSAYGLSRGIKVSVPYRSQLDVEREDVRDVVCCPTCVAMLLEGIGVSKPTLDVCDVAYSERHDIYGIWPRAAQAAFQFGAKAWVDRFRTMEAVAKCLESGQPIIASIRVKKGQLRGARYPESAGHLIVIKGISDSGNIIVNDPYSAGPEGHEIEYQAEDIEKCWLDCGGVAIMVSQQ